MAYVSITTDQMASAASYISRNWGDYGYRITGIRSETHVVACFEVRSSDGSTFTVLADKWGNCREMAAEDDMQTLIMEMHAVATAA